MVASFSASMKQPLEMPAYLGLTASRAVARERTPDPTNPPEPVAKASRQCDRPVAASQGQVVAGAVGPGYRLLSANPGAVLGRLGQPDLR